MLKKLPGSINRYCNPTGIGYCAQPSSTDSADCPVRLGLVLLFAFLLLLTLHAFLRLLFLHLDHGS